MSTLLSTPDFWYLYHIPIFLESLKHNETIFKTLNVINDFLKKKFKETKCLEINKN